MRRQPATGCGCDPLAAGPFAGADALRPVSQMSIAAFSAPSRTGASRTGSGAHPRARGAPHGGRGAPRAVGIRPGKCAQVRLRWSALTFGYAVRLRPVSRRPACGSRRNAPRFTDIDRSLVRPFPHRRYAYRVRGASPLRGAPAPGFAEPCSAVRGRTSLRFAPRLRHISPLLFIPTHVRSSRISAMNSDALH